MIKHKQHHFLKKFLSIGHYFAYFCLGAFLVVCSKTLFAILPSHLDFDKKYEIPLREVAIILTDEGYYPQNIQFFVGENVRIYLTSTRTKPGCFYIPEKNVFQAVDPKKLAIVELFFEREQKLSFMCPTGKSIGQIVVAKHPRVKKMLNDLRQERQQQKEVERDLASVGGWRPSE